MLHCIRRATVLALVVSFATSLAWAGGGSGRGGPARKAWTAKKTAFEHTTHGKSKIGWERRATGKDGVTKIHGVLWGSKVKGEEFVSADGTRVSTMKATSPSGDVRTTRTEKYRVPRAGKVVERKRVLMPRERARKDIIVQEIDGRRYTSTTDTSLAANGTERQVLRDELYRTVVKLTRWTLGRSVQFDRREYDMDSGKLVKRTRGGAKLQADQKPGARYDGNMNTPLETPVP